MVLVPGDPGPRRPAGRLSSRQVGTRARKEPRPFSMAAPRLGPGTRHSRCAGLGSPGGLPGPDLLDRLRPGADRLHGAGGRAREPRLCGGRNRQYLQRARGCIPGRTRDKPCSRGRSPGRVTPDREDRRRPAGDGLGGRRDLRHRPTGSPERRREQRVLWTPGRHPSRRLRALLRRRCGSRGLQPRQPL